MKTLLLQMKISFSMQLFKKKTKSVTIHNGSEIVLLAYYKINSMKSRILKAVVAMVAPLVIEFIVKKISEKIDQKSQPKEPKKLPASIH